MAISSAGNISRVSTSLRTFTLITQLQKNALRVFREEQRISTGNRLLSIADDPYGIPHVRFHVSFRRPNRNFFDGGARMLALSSFADRYTELVG